MNNQTISGNDILAALTSGGLTEAQVVEAINEHRRRERAIKLMAAQTLKIGERCTISGIRPKRLNGTIGTITGFNSTRTRADLKVEKTGDPFDNLHPKGSHIHGIPLVCLTKVEDK